LSVVLVATWPAVAAAFFHQQERCTKVMYAHRKNDTFAVLDFALRFRLPWLQGSCLAHLSQVTRGRLVDKAERIVKVGHSSVSAWMLSDKACLELRRWMHGQGHLSQVTRGRLVDKAERFVQVGPSCLLCFWSMQGTSMPLPASACA
jgi:hypothetical protein